jgi:glycerophosphoryl diester phosphodiesterase
MEKETISNGMHVIFSEPISKVIGHRGGGGNFGPENQLHTLKKAVECGVRLLEFDIRLTQDGYLVICHDDENWFGTISEMSYSSLNEVDSASMWSPDNGNSYPLKGQGHKIATLHQIFDEFSSNKEVYFFLDLKSSNIAEKVFQVVESYQLMDQIIVGAMNDAINKEMMTHKPSHVPSTCSLNDTIRLITKWSLPFGNYWFSNDISQMKQNVIMFPLGYEVFGGITCSTFLSVDFVTACHNNNKKIWVFGPGLDLLELQNHALRKLKVDAIIADLPDVALLNLTK